MGGGGGVFAPDASELISGRTEQMLLFLTHQLTKPSELISLSQKHLMTLTQEQFSNHKISLADKYAKWLI